MPETSASLPSCSLLTPSLAGERIGKGEEGIRAETHLWTFQRTFHPADIAAPRKYGCSFADIIFGGSDLMDQSGYAPCVVLVQLFVLLCCQTDQETALKKAAPSPPRLFLPWLISQTQFTLSPLRCNWRKSAGMGKCSQKQANWGLPKSTQKCPWPNTSGRVSLQQSQAACLSELERSKTRKGRLNPCRHVEHLHTIFLWKT